MNTPPSLQNVKETFIEGAGQLSASLLGILNKVCGQIFALLLLSPKSLSLDDIVEALGVSKGNVSINIRLLEEYKLVKKVWVKNSRRDYYEAVVKVPTKVINEFLEKIRRNIEDSLAVIKVCQDKLKTIDDRDDADEREHMGSQLELAASFFSGAAFLFERLYAGETLNTELLAMLLKND